MMVVVVVVIDDKDVSPLSAEHPGYLKDSLRKSMRKSFIASPRFGPVHHPTFISMSCGDDVKMDDTYVTTFSTFRLGLIDYPSPVNEPEDI